MDITSILSTIDLNQIILVMSGIIAVLGYIVAAIENVKKKNTQGALENSEKAVEAGKKVLSDAIDLFSSDVPQTEAQTTLLENGTVPAKTCFMSDANKDQLFHDLRNWGAEIRKGDLLAVIAKAEAESQVEYGIILHDHKGNTDRSIINKGKGSDQEHEVYHAFVSYGNTSVQTYDDTMIKVDETSSKTYPLEIYWYMTEAERTRLISEIGTSYPKCIAEAIDQVNLAEINQTEHYYVHCNSCAWEINQGNIVRELATPDDAV